MIPHLLRYEATARVEPAQRREWRACVTVTLPTANDDDTALTRHPAQKGKQHEREIDEQG
jgi:hypothetical protein